MFKNSFELCVNYLYSFLPQQKVTAIDIQEVIWKIPGDISSELMPSWFTVAPFIDSLLQVHTQNIGPACICCVFVTHMLYVETLP